jgi:hypothetical protein
MVKNKLLSGRVKVTPSANVTEDRYQFLGLEQAEPNLGIAPADGYVLIYDSNAPGQRNWSSTSLLSGGLTAQSAFDAANSASIYANSSFVVANSASIYANGAFVSANSASSYANGAFITANSAASYANASFETANSAGVYANAAFAAANIADQKAVTSGDYANSAYIHANAAYAAANNKLDLTGGTITGDLSIAGNLTVSGNTIQIDVTTLNVTDPIIYLAANNYDSDVVGIGFVGNYNDGTTNRHAGLIRMEGSNTFYLFTNYDDEFDTNTLDLSNPSLYQAELRANVIANTVIVRNVEVLTQANAAFTAANTADQRAVTSGTYANAAFAAANTADQKAVTSGSYANSAYIHANAAFNAANNAVDTWVRDAANSASSYANGAFVAANTADQKAITSGSYANSSYIHANAAFNAANNAVDTWVRDAANSASSYANGAFAIGNTANTLAQAAYDAANNATDTWVRTAANSASSYANSGYVHANAAFDKANLSANLANSQFGVSISLDAFTGDNSCTTFTLSTTPVSENFTLVTLNGLTQHKSAYNISGANVVFSEAPGTNVAIDVVTFTSQESISVGVSITLDSFTGDNSCTTFALTTTPINENYTSVVIDGVTQLKTSYNISGSDIVFSEAPGSNTNIEVTTYQSADVYASNTLAQIARDHANAAFDTANNATDTWVRNAANAASSYANSGFVAANTADQRAVTSGSYANAAFAAANTADQRAVTSGTYANAAFATANLKYDATGGTISGDVIVSGNLTVSGQTTYANSTVVNLGDAIITLNADIPQAFAPSENAGVEVDRGASANVGLIWNETTDKWTFTNDGSSYSDIGSSAAESYANAAFAASNTADQRAVTSGSYANSAFTAANTADQRAVTSGSYANSAFSAANTADQRAVTSGSYANSAYLHANSAYNAANNATDTWVRNAANAASSYANSAYAQANTGTTLAQAAFNAANNAVDTWVRDAANSASSYANGAFAIGNTANTLAQAAFDAANTAGGDDTYARAHANAAYLHANAAFETANSGGGATTDSYARAHANAAYAQANSGGSEIYVASLENFTSNGTNTIFTLAVTPTSANQLFVYVDGVYQQASAYSLTGNTITLSEALDANSILEVRVLANTTPSQLGVKVNEFIGTGACTTFSLSSVPVNKNLTSVIVGGVPQMKSSYTITGSSIVFTEAPANSANIEVTVYSGGGGYAASFSTVVDTFSGDGSSLEFTLSTLPQNENHTFVYLNGVYQNKSVYTISGANVIFTEAATANDTLEVVTVAGSEMNVTSSRYNSRIYTGGSACTEFTISSGHSANSVLVFENGICQAPIADYTVSGTILTFTTAPADGVQIQIRELPV